MPDDLEIKIKEQIAKLERKECSLQEAFNEVQRLKLCGLTLENVLLHPVKYSKKGFWAALDDCRVIDSTKLTERQKKYYKIAMPLGAFLSFGVWAIPHELMHAGINKLTGGINHEIVLNKIYGADFVHSFFPDIQSKLMLPFIGGYVNAAPSSDIAGIIMSIAPYALTPIGVYFIQKSCDKQSAKYWVIGAGLVGAHSCGVLGDFFVAGRYVTNAVCKKLYKDPYEIMKQEQVSGFDTIVLGATLVAGFLLGNRIMGYTYRLAKGTVNSLRTYLSKT